MAIANALRQKAMQGFEPQQTQVINGWAVPQSAWGGIAKALLDTGGNALVANKMDKENDAARLKMNQDYLTRMVGLLNGQQPQPAQAPQGAPSIQPQPAPQGGNVDNQAQGAPVVGAPMGNSEMPQANPQSMAPNVPQQQPQPPQNNQYNVNNLMRGNAISQIGGDQAGAAYWKQFEPTPEQKNAQWLGRGVPEMLAAARAKDLKEGTMTFQPNQVSRFPTGETYVTPDFAHGTFGAIGPNGNPVMGGIQGNQVLANLAGQQAGAVEAGKAPYQLQTVNLPGGPKMATNAQLINAANRNGGLNLQQPEQQKIQDAKAAAAISAAQTNAQVEPLKAILNQALTLAPKVPQGQFTGGLQVAAQNAAPQLFGSEGAGAAAQWDQMMGQNILNTIKNLQSAGSLRMDIPIVKEIQKAGGIPSWLPLESKIKLINQLQREVENTQTSAGNVIPQLNQTNLGSTTQQPMQSVGTQNKVINFSDLK